MKKTFFFITLSALSVAACAHEGTASEGSAIHRDDFVTAAEQTVNGVVSIKSFATPAMQNSGGYGRYGSYGDPLLDYFFGVPQQRRHEPRQQPRQQQTGLGSGVIISTDGYIVTNNHVIADAERLEVTLNDNRNFTAKVIGSDETTDLALIKIEAPDLHVIPMGDSEKLRVGEWVLAVGNPFGFTSTVTSGIVSAKARNISTSTGAPSGGGIEAYIQTDAAVNRGNSGGALVNLDGELVGINTAIYSQTGTYAGCSFAIPVSIVQKVVGDLKAYGNVQRAFLGVRFVEVSPELIAEKGLPSQPSAGVYIISVEERSAAMEAGIVSGDVIVALGDKPVRSTAEMQEAITRFSPGQSATIRFWRDGTEMETRVTFRNSRGDTSITPQVQGNILGAELSALGAEQAQRMQLRSGVSVDSVEADGRLGRAGVRPGFVILGVNGQRVASPEDIDAISRAVLNSNNIADKVLFISGIYANGKAAYYAIALDD